MDYRDKLPSRPVAHFYAAAPVHFYAAVDMLITGAMAVVRWAVRRGRTNDPWLARMLARMLVAVALANRMARIVWALMTKKESYRAPATA